MHSVPDLSYMSVWTNDSGAGFEHTGSLYVGRNGGPYMIREWRNHDKIAQAAGQSIGATSRTSAPPPPRSTPTSTSSSASSPSRSSTTTSRPRWAATSPGRRRRCSSAATTSPTPPAKYPENQGVAGSLFHTGWTKSEKDALATARAANVDPILHYSASAP
jgi:hypothetical protein